MAIVCTAAYPAVMNEDEDGFARSDAEVRRVLELARAGIARYGFGEELHPEDLARPWAQSGPWKDNAWLRGVRDLLEWVAGDVAAGPLRGTPAAQPGPYDVYDDTADLEEIMRQGSRCPVWPGWPPPQSGEAINATVHWLDGETEVPPVCEHALGAYQCGCQDLSWMATDG
jgi:hypothetical protein